MRKSLLTAAAVVAAVSMLTACGGGDDNDTPAETTSPTQAESEAPVSATGSLTIWVDENRKPAVQAAVDIYNETNPDVKVTLVQKNFEDIRADFLAQVPTGEGPDITIGAHDWLGGLIVNGVVDTIDIGDKAGEFETVATQAFTQDGQMYGLPYALESVAIVRNTALVDSTPATWDEMIAMGKAAGTKYPFVINVNGTTGDAYTSYALQTSFGAPVFKQNEDGSYTNELGMAGPEGFAWADFLAANGMKAPATSARTGRTTSRTRSSPPATPRTRSPVRGRSRPTRTRASTWPSTRSRPRVVRMPHRSSACRASTCRRRARTSSSPTTSW